LPYIHEAIVSIPSTAKRREGGKRKEGREEGQREGKKEEREGKIISTRPKHFSQ
jgi:hypothetical protein